MSNPNADTKVTKSKGNSYNRRIAGDVAAYIFLTVMAIIWLIPIVWVVLESFNANTQPYQSTFFPTKYTFHNYVQLFTETDVMNFPRMFMNTLVIAIFVCIISLFFVLSVSFCMSRLRFRGRRTFMNIALILGMFPSIMAVVAIYFILKAFGLTEGAFVIIALILVVVVGVGVWCVGGCVGVFRSDRGLLGRLRRRLLRHEGLHGHHPDVA